VTTFYTGAPWENQFYVSYNGRVFGKYDAPPSARSSSGIDWTAYFVPGGASTGAMLWDIGNYGFSTGQATPPFGCHNDGGNEAFTDGSVRWRKY
jgi:hypothetical protein